VRARRIALAAALVAAALVGSEARTDETDASRTEAPSRPARVATLLPFAEDALRLAPAAVEIVATVRRSLHTPVPEGAIDLGNPHSPSFERLAEARPDLVVGDAGIHAALAPKIERLGMEVVLLDVPSVEATFAELERLGARLGIEATVHAAAEAARAELAASALEKPIPTLALFGTPGSFFAVTERTWLGDLLERMNFRNVAPRQGGDERFPGLVALSDEALALLRPELVVLVAHGDPDAIRRAFDRKIAAGGPWGSVRESAAGNVHVLEGRWFAANPGLALPRAAHALAELAEDDGA